jgi:hypothetical protein
MKGAAMRFVRDKSAATAIEYSLLASLYCNGDYHDRIGSGQKSRRQMRSHESKRLFIFSSRTPKRATHPFSL